MKRFDIAIVGCGGISSMHLAGYAERPERVNIVATCDIIPERAERAAATCGARAAFASVEEAIQGAPWEVAVVCTPTPVREQILKPLAAAGKHIFIEKPMADSIGEATRMVDLADAAGVKLAVNQTFRYHWGFDIARQAISDGRLGRVLSVVHRSMFFRQDSGWRVDCKRHAISVMGVHWLDGFRWALGAEAKTVSSVMHSSPAVECAGETDANVQIAFDNGTAVSFVQSFSCPGGPSDTVIVGEKGALRLQGGAELYETDSRGEPVERWDNPLAGNGKAKTAFKLLDELLTAIEDGTEPPNNCHDNLKTISLLEAVYRSADAGRPVALEEGLIA